MILEFMAILAGIIIQVFFIGFPKETLLLQSGIIFGIVVGSILNWVGMVVAAQVGYEVVRRSVEFGGRYAKLLSEYEETIVLQKLQAGGNKGLFVLRLLPFSPNDVLSLISGAVKLPRKGFILVSIITAVPFAVIFAYLGHLGQEFIGYEAILPINVGLIILGLGYSIFIWLRTRKDIPSEIENIE